MVVPPTLSPSLERGERAIYRIELVRLVLHIYSEGESGGRNLAASLPPSVCLLFKWHSVVRSQGVSMLGHFLSQHIMALF